MRIVRLKELAVTRSGDKGNHINLGVIAYSPEAYEILVRHLTSDVVSQFFAWTGVERVERYLLPNVQAMNFVMYNALGGGASRSLRLDSQGKLVGTAAQYIQLQIPSADASRQETCS